jgi:hypothetical protein
MHRAGTESSVTVRRTRDRIEADRERLERLVATLQIERNEIRRAMRSNADTCRAALQRAIEAGDKELKEWLASTRTDGTPRPPNAVVITRYLLESTDFADWLAARLEEAIAADDQTFDPRSSAQLEELDREAEARLAEARTELKRRAEDCLAVGAAVRAAERGDRRTVERFLGQLADDPA